MAVSKQTRVGRLLNLSAVTAFRHPWWASLLVLVISAVLGTGATRLKINPDISELLPRTFSSVQNLERLRNEFGGIGYLSILIEGDDTEALKRFVDEIEPKLTRLSTVRYVEAKRPVEFFDKRALFYMELADLETIQSRFAAREHYERLRANPLFIDLEEENPPSLDFSDIREKYEDKGGRANDEPYLLDEKHGRLVLFVKPSQLASNLDFAKTLVQDVRSVLDSSMPDGVQYQLSGRYKKRIDMQKLITSDLGMASGVAILLMLAYLGLHFRRASSVVLVATPLLIGLLWTYGFAGWTLQTLNILTAFVGAILLGVGIDVGIHILDRAEADEKSGEEGLNTAFGHTGRAAVIATLTTVAGFASLAFSDFRVFQEFGILSSSGLLFVLISYLLCLPVLLRWRESLAKKRIQAPDEEPFPSASRILRSSPWLFWCGMLLIWGALLWIPKASFDYDFASLENQDLESYQLDREINEFLGYSQTPLIVQTASVEESEYVAGILRERAKLSPRIDKVTSGQELVPKNQAEKVIVFAKLNKTIDLIEVETLSESEQEDLKKLRERTSERQFGYSDLPESVRRNFHATDGSGQFVLVFPGISLSDGALIRKLAHELRDIPSTTKGTTISATGEAMVLSDVLDSVFYETPRSIAIAGLVIFLTLWILIGRLRSALLCMVPAVFTVVVTIGLMPHVGIEFNYLNIIVLPVILGIAVDGGTHLLHRIEDEESILLGLKRAGHSILGALVTTALGFVALLAADHPGLNTIGKIALLGLAVNLVATLLFLPATIAMWTRHSPYKETSGIVAQLATMGRAGRASLGPGSLGALLALPIAWLLTDVPVWQWAILLVLMTVASIWIGELYVKSSGSKDPQEVVLDETLGCLIALAFVPFTFVWALAAYVLFRLFDIWKPWPVRYFDRRVTGGLGVMMDDVAAGLMAGPILLLIQYLV